MKTKLLLMMTLILLNNLVVSQVNTLIDADRMNVIDLAIDNNGNQIIVGNLRHSNVGTPYTNDFDPSNDTFSLPNTNFLDGVTGFVASYNKSGQINYAFQINDADITPNVSNILVESDASNNIYIYGGFTGKADLDPSNNVVELNTGNIFTNGEFLASYDENGNFRFAVPFPPNAFNNLFTTVPKILSVDAAGNSYVLFDPFITTFDYDPGAGEFLIPSGRYILSYDTNGNFRFGYEVPSGTDAIGCNALGDHFVAGNLQSFDANFDFDPSSNVFTLGNVDNSSFFFASYTKDGGFNYVKDLKGSDAPSILGVIAAPVRIIGNDNNIFIAGELGAGTVDFDPTANELNVSVSGFEPDTGDMFFAKYTKTGDVVFAKAIQDKVGNVANEIITDFEIDNNENLYLTGIFTNGIIDFDLSGTENLISATNLFVASYDNNGDYRFAYSVNSSSSNHNILETDPNCSYYYVAATENHDTTLEFIQEEIPFQFTTGNTFGRDYPFITKIKEGTMVNGSCSTLSVDEFNSLKEIKLFPVPIENQLNIDLSPSFVIQKTEIVTILGQTVYSNNDHKTNLDLSSLKSGIYILSLETTSGTASFKIIKK